MFRFMQRLGRDSHARWRGTGPLAHARRRNHQLNCEALEGRQLLSLPAYYIVNASSGKVLDDPGRSTSNDAHIDQWQLNGGTNQQWTLVPLADGNDEIVNAFSGKVLDDPAFSTSNGTVIQQYQLKGGLNQQWKLVALADGNDEIVNAYSRKVLDDPGGSTSNGTDITQYQPKGGANQQWALIPAGNSAATTYSVNNAYSGLAIDDPNSSTSNGTGIIQYQPKGGANQQWTFVPLANGNDLIVNASSGKVLDDPNFSTSEGTDIDQYQLNGGLNQQWRFYRLTNGNYAIFNESSNLALDDPNFATTNGAPVDQWQWNGGLNQQWKVFVPNTTAITSPNWSGYFAATNVSAPQNDSVTYVAGSWTVPTVTATSGNTDSFAWVGIDGWHGGTVEQTGTAEGVYNGVPYYFAWWEMWSTNGYAGPGGRVDQSIASMRVSPGDSITASVTYENSGTYAGDYLLSINDTSQSNDSFSIYRNPSQFQNPLPDRNTAEWIMETPTQNGGYTTLPNFGSITFTNCYATINGTTGPINASSWQSQAVNLSSNGVSYDTTTNLTQSGASFAVIYDSAGTGGQSGTNAQSTTHIGPTVGATPHSGKKTHGHVIRRHAGTEAPGLPRYRRPTGQHERSAQRS